MGQSGVGGSGSILGNLVAKRSQINKIREKLGFTPGNDMGGVPQGGLKRTAPTSPAGPAVPPAAPAAASPVVQQTKPPTTVPGPVPTVAADKRKAMLEQAATFLSGLQKATPAQPAAPAQPVATTPLGRARQILSGGV